MPKQEKEFSVPEKLAHLYKLQVLVSEIDRIKNLRGELPQEVTDMETVLENLEAQVEKIREEIATCKKKRLEMQGNIADAQAHIDRYNTQLNDVQNNKEYDFLTREINFQQLDINLCNKRIAEGENLLADLQAKESKTLAQIEECRSELELKKGELDEIIAETRNEEETLRDKAKKIENNVDTKLLATFRRIHKKAHNGLAIVAVENNACTGCFNKITPQREIDIKMRKKIISCEYCGRILIDAELAKANEMRRRSKPAY